MAQRKKVYSKNFITPQEERDNVESKIFQLDSTLLTKKGRRFKVMEYIDASNRLDKLAFIIARRISYVVWTVNHATNVKYSTLAYAHDITNADIAEPLTRDRAN